MSLPSAYRALRAAAYCQAGLSWPGWRSTPMASADPASISWMSRPATARGRSPAAVSTEYRPPMEAGTEKVA